MGEEVTAVAGVRQEGGATASPEPHHRVDQNGVDHGPGTDQHQVEQERKEAGHQAGAQAGPAFVVGRDEGRDDHQQRGGGQHDLVEHGQAAQAGTNRGGATVLAVQYQGGPGGQQAQAGHPRVGHEAERGQQGPRGQGGACRGGQAPAAGQPVDAPQQQEPVGQADQAFGGHRGAEHREGAGDGPDAARGGKVGHVGVGQPAIQDPGGHHQDGALLHGGGRRAQHAGHRDQHGDQWDGQRCQFRPGGAVVDEGGETTPAGRLVRGIHGRRSYGTG